MRTLIRCVCKLDGGGGGGCCAADSDWDSAEVWAAHRPLVWALILYTQGSWGPRWFSIAAVIQLPGRQTRTAPKTHNNPPALEISSRRAVSSLTCSLCWWFAFTFTLLVGKIKPFYKEDEG